MNTISKVLAVCFSFILLNAHAFDPINDDMAFILNYKMPFGKTLLNIRFQYLADIQVEYSERLLSSVRGHKEIYVFIPQKGEILVLPFPFSSI